MKIYDLYAWDSGATYFLSVSDTENKDKKIATIINVKEIIPHSQYQVTLIKPDSQETDSVIIHGGLLTMHNLTSIAFNFANNFQDILNNVQPYPVSISNDD